ncbi:Extracellular serine/threonine protein kinase FAM20C [Larimichthys crocea]|uniref:Uncharacterized protein n=1 Tax=Larimichthys crocea TaxID=215358 RepID=A0ACD3RV23_LARCR|nr:Extracellular serine/threonine protein kinase FAM20C [Larimichthys crocea]
MPEEMRVETMELCVTACEKFATNNESAAKMIKESMDKKFGSSWHVVIGEGFGFEVTHEHLCHGKHSALYLSNLLPPAVKGGRKDGASLKKAFSDILPSCQLSLIHCCTRGCLPPPALCLHRITPHLGMMWRIRSRSRTICLSLALITVFLYLLLALVSLPIYHQPCDTPKAPGTHILRDLAHTDYTSVGMNGLAEPPAETTHRDSSNKDANKDAKGYVRILSDVLLVKEGKNASINMPVNAGRHGTNRAESAESGLSKLKALFDHPLYNMPSPPIPEEDWLLKVKSKVKASEKSSQMWVSASQEGYEEVNWNSNSDSHPPWLRFHLGISCWQLYPHLDPNMESLIQQLATHRIVSAVQKSGGTQLKLVMSFPNYGQAMFKPMKQERDEETNYNLYYFSDFERHNAEIAAFHLDRILGYRRIPPVVGRLVDVVKEIKDVTTDHKLARTFFTSPGTAHTIFHYSFGLLKMPLRVN